MSFGRTATATRASRRQGYVCIACGRSAIRGKDCGRPKCRAVTRPKKARKTKATKAG